MCEYSILPKGDINEERNFEEKKIKILSLKSTITKVQKFTKGT